MTQQIVDGKRVVFAIISFINSLRQDQVVHANTCILSHNFSKKTKQTKQNKQTNNFTQWNESKNGTYKLGNALITSVVSRFYTALNPWS